MQFVVIKHTFAINNNSLLQDYLLKEEEVQKMKNYYWKRYQIDS